MRDDFSQATKNLLVNIPENADINTEHSSHVETVVLMSRVAK